MILGAKFTPLAKLMEFQIFLGRIYYIKFFLGLILNIPFFIFKKKLKTQLAQRYLVGNYCKNHFCPLKFALDPAFARNFHHGFQIEVLFASNFQHAFQMDVMFVSDFQHGFKMKFMFSLNFRKWSFGSPIQPPFGFRALVRR